jgi:aspartate kinase
MAGRRTCIVVIKVGGSVLENTAAYESCARFLARRLHRCFHERLVVVVSAQDGLTDALERLARDTVGNAGQRALDLLWSTGETRSVALLTLFLQKLGVEAAGLNVHETGIRITGNCEFPRNVILVQEGIQRALSESQIAVVPGFLGTDDNGVIRSLGRGGSDLTAVVVAHALQAAQCELIKDVPGYFSKDPHKHPTARHMPALTFHQAIAMAGRGCCLVQKGALQLAKQAGLKIVVRSLNDEMRSTVIAEEVRTGSTRMDYLEQDCVAES